MATMEQNQPNTGKAEEVVRSDENEKVQQDTPNTAVNGQPNAPDKQEPDEKQEQEDEKGPEPKKEGPEGGFDSTPIPKPPAGTVGYTLKITMHRATSLAFGDAHVMSSDPYVLAQLNTDLPMRHKEDPNLRFRTATIRRTTDPTWDEEWIVANAPSSGFTLKLRVYDEDPADHDDQLGKVHITVPSLSDNWPGIKNEKYRLLIRNSSRRAILIRAVARCFRFVRKFRGDLYVSIEILGRTGDDGQNGRPYTVGPCRWTRHYSPLLGRLTNIKDDEHPTRSETRDSHGKKKSTQHFDFQANEMQLPGPVPPELYHRFVEFKPWVGRMFTSKGFQGVVLGKALHHQHNRVYNFDRSTRWGRFEGAGSEMTQKFLDLVHYDKGGRIYTYVLTLDALLRFTETGKEFGIDMLSKHTMHSDVSIYIAFSGEFFIRRLKHRNRPPPPHPTEATSQQNPPEHDPNPQHPPDIIEEGPPDDDPPTDPSYYELVIDNDSGTYRPNAKMLPKLYAFLAHSLPGLHIQTLDCNADKDKMAKMKQQQRDRKAAEGNNAVYTQADDSSISSSDDERLNAVRPDDGRGDVATGDGSGRERGHVHMLAKDVKMHQKENMAKFQRSYWTGRDEEEGMADEEEQQGRSTETAGGPST